MTPQSHCNPHSQKGHAPCVSVTQGRTHTSLSLTIALTLRDKITPSLKRPQPQRGGRTRVAALRPSTLWAPPAIPLSPPLAVPHGRQLRLRSRLRGDPSGFFLGRVPLTRSTQHGARKKNRRSKSPRRLWDVKFQVVKVLKQSNCRAGLGDFWEWPPHCACAALVSQRPEAQPEAEGGFSCSQGEEAASKGGAGPEDCEEGPAELFFSKASGLRVKGLSSWIK